MRRGNTELADALAKVVEHLRVEKCDCYDLSIEFEAEDYHTDSGMRMTRPSGVQRWSFMLVYGVRDDGATSTE